jgi:chitinase
MLADVWRSEGNAPPFSWPGAVMSFGVRIGALWIAGLAAVALPGCAAIDGPTPDSGAPAFVYSPYKYVPIALQRDSLAIATDGAARPLVSDGRSTLPDGVPALTLAFATGECGQETWEGIDTDRLVGNLRALARAGVRYIVSTGGAGAAFTCRTAEGMNAFIARYATPALIGFDFDIENGQAEATIVSLVARIREAQRRHPHLRFSFTLPTWAGDDGSMTSLNEDGERVMRVVREAQLTGYYVNLMVMNYGDALPRNCVVIDGRCDMGKSAVQAARNFNAVYGVPFGRMELTPMIGINDVSANVFTLDDAVTLAQFVRNEGLAGAHFWSLDRDGSCDGDAAVVSATCSGLRGLAPLAFTRAFRDALVRQSF